MNTSVRFPAMFTPLALFVTIETPRVKIVDLGTEFGVEAAKHGSADVKMIEGKMRINSPGVALAPFKSTKVVEGEAVSRGAITGVSKQPFAPENFFSVFLTRNGQTASLRINGNTAAFDTYAPAGAPSDKQDNGYCLGVRSDDGQLHPGHQHFGKSEIQEIIAFDRALEGPDLKAINEYLGRYPP